MLRRLVADQEILADAVQSVLSMLDGSAAHFIMVPREAFALHTALLWEAPKNTIAHFPDRVPNNYELDHRRIFDTSRLPRYSDGLCHRPIDRLEPVE